MHGFPPTGHTHTYTHTHVTIFGKGPVQCNNISKKLYELEADLDFSEIYKKTIYLFFFLDFFIYILSLFLDFFLYILSLFLDFFIFILSLFLDFFLDFFLYILSLFLDFFIYILFFFLDFFLCSYKAISVTYFSSIFKYHKVICEPDSIRATTPGDPT